MKHITALGLLLSAGLFANTVIAAGSIPKDMLEDAEYMMRKVVEDIHARSLRNIVSDKTLDKSIHVVGRAQKFIPAHKDAKTGEIFTCARVSLKTKITASKAATKSIKRTDEICTASASGTVRYMANIK